MNTGKIIKAAATKIGNHFTWCYIPSQKAYTMLGIAKAAIEQYGGGYLLI